jgi:hypothetical protein
MLTITISERIHELRKSLANRVYKKRGSVEKRAQFETMVEKGLKLINPIGIGNRLASYYYTSSANNRYKAWIARKAVELADKAGQKFDEHGSGRGDYMTTRGIDYIAPWKGSAKAPFFDMGGEGLGLVEITRKRVYAKSYSFGPSFASTRYLVGKNEAGTYFTHPVPATCSTVESAIQWIWGGHARDVVARQGDIALIRGAGPKLPSNLPSGHRVDGNQIVHATHPTIRIPGKGERVIVGRRAFVRVSEATRD